MNKICIIGVYLGKLPNYFPLWLKSCEANPTVDFKVFTDQTYGDLPQNVQLYPMTLAKMKSLAEDVLGMPVSLETPYKCCDYKVIYGLLFKDYLTQYAYWGHCDFDVIFGDVQAFCDNYCIHRFDRFLPLGHLSLYKNTDEVNQRFRCKGSAYDYISVYSSEKIFVFDEIPGMVQIYIANHFPMFTARVFADIASVYHRYRVIEEYNLDKKVRNYKHQIFYWENGKVYRAFYKKGKLTEEEYMYIHFKKRPNFAVDFAINETNAFYITNRGFFPKCGKPTQDVIQRLNPYPGAIYEMYEFVRYRVRAYTAGLLRRIRRIVGHDDT